MLDSDQIKKIRESEERRGSRRKPAPDANLVENKRRKLAALRAILWAPESTVDDVESAMIGQGISPDSEQWNELLDSWRAERRKKHLSF